jgi:hypothetical protein
MNKYLHTLTGSGKEKNMPFEIRKVSKDWKHPRDENGRFIPLFGCSYSKCCAEWDEEKEMWDTGFVLLYSPTGPHVRTYKPKEENLCSLTFEERQGWGRPIQEEYMPEREPEEKTHFQMYETVSLGTPISPIKETQEELEERLIENWVFPFTGKKATYKEWLQDTKDGYCLEFYQNGDNIIFSAGRMSISEKEEI